MANRYIRLVDKQEIVQGETGESIELGDCRSLGIQVRAIRAGESGDEIEIQHAATNEDGAFTTLGTAVAIDGEVNNIQYHDEFLRFVRWKANTITGTPLLIIDVVAKEY